MSFTRAKPAGFAPGDRLLSTEIEIIDVNQSRSLDTYAGGTYATNAGQTIGITTRVSLTDLSGTIQSGSTLTVMPGAYVICPGSLYISSGGKQDVQNGGNLNVKGGGHVHVEAGAEIALATGGILYGASGSVVNIEGTFTFGNGCTASIEDVSDFSSTAYTRYRYYTAPHGLGASVNFTAESTLGTHLHWIQGSTPVIGDHFQFSLTEIPRQTILTDVQVYVKGATAARGTLPTNFPSIWLGRMNIATGIITNLSSANDSAHSAYTTYEVSHYFGMTGLNQSLDGGYAYVLTFRGESGGAGAIAGLECYSIRLTFTSTTPIGIS